LSDYSGKSIEPSFNLINFAKKHKAVAKRYPLVENDNSEYKTYNLNKNIAKRLFFKDEMLEGSISAFEQYNSCNYSYFLKRGLKLYTKELPDLSYAYIGSIIHEVMEAVTNRQINGLSILDKSEVEAIVYELMSPIEALNPGDSKTKIVKRLLIRQINDVLEHMRSIESDTKFKPIMAEQKFTYTINNNIRLYGFVDRVDSYLENIRVIDFKSSKQNLSEKEFKQGLQLQLITYLMAISNFYNQRPAGAFYHTMRLDNTNVIAGTAKKTKDMFYPLTEEEVETNFLSNNRLAGWHFNDEADTFYSSQNYVAGLNEGKSGLSVRGKAKNFDTVATILEAVYKDIYNNLNEGIIDCIPIDNPCQYCDYHSICLSKTTSNFKELIYKDQKISEEINNEVD
ncbi:MAG TPA: PD-(D/E)XK nuclease family protein, partial [Erysipelotrichaceae bacterium]|nr:PD-(D/E)XK nuclease family protein [Erysipelotrichaceae bacterium]